MNFVNKYGFERKYVPARNRTEAYAQCKCGHEEYIVDQHEAQPQIIVKKFRDRGWEIGKRMKPVCRSCQEKREKERKMQQNGNTIHHPAHPAPTAKAFSADTPPPRALTPLESMRALDALRECFDETKGAYLDGKSDKKLGEELQIPWASLAAHREAIGMRIKGNPEIIALKQELATLREMMNEAERRLAALETSR